MKTKKYISLLLISIILTASSGINVYMHICFHSGEKGISLFGENSADICNNVHHDKCCHHISKQNSCCESEIREDSDKQHCDLQLEAPCCMNMEKYISLEADFLIDNNTLNIDIPIIYADYEKTNEDDLRTCKRQHIINKTRDLPDFSYFIIDFIHSSSTPNCEDLLIS